MASLTGPTPPWFGNYAEDYANDGYDYTATKCAYFQKLLHIYNYRYLNPAFGGAKVIARSETVNKIIEAIENFKPPSSTTDSPPEVNSSDLDVPLLNALVLTYKVVNQDGLKILGRKTINKIQKKVVRVLGFDNAFEVLSETHRKYGHCNGAKLEKLLKDNYQIPDQCYQLFTEFCNVCQENRCFGKNAKVTLIREKDYSLLLYQDAWSNYTLLRAMPSTIRYKEEVVIELLKIFTDFGVPDKIFVAGPRKDFYKVVLKDINKFLHCDVDVQKIRSYNYFPHQEGVNNILKMLETWKKSNNCEDHEFACYAVQVQINNTKPDPDTDCPYEMVFGKLNMGENWPFTNSSSEVVPDTDGMEIPTIELD